MSDQPMKAEYADRIDRLTELAEAERELQQASSKFEQAQREVVRAAERLQEWANVWKYRRESVLSRFPESLTPERVTFYGQGDRLTEANEVLRQFCANVEAKNKAIAALSTETKGGLLDENLETASPEFASEQGSPLPSMDDIIDPDLTGGLQTEEYLDRLHEGTLPDAERTSDESQAEPVTEQSGIEYYVDGGPVQTTSALIADEIPSIPREEIPVGAAVETYTDSRGLETVKISGTTYVVDETATEAAYAPIHNQDEPSNEALMWANGFEADARAKAEPEQDKRPFWMFAKKVDA